MNNEDDIQEIEKPSESDMSTHFVDQLDTILNELQPDQHSQHDEDDTVQGGHFHCLSNFHQGSSTKSWLVLIVW